MSYIVAIDGPAGSGKGTITKLVAKDLGLVSIDTGMLYRCHALAVLKNNIDVSDEEKVEEILEKIDINTIRRFMLQNENIYIYLDEKPVPEKAKELKNVKEIEYSYGHIVARAKTYDLKMNILPLDGEILVFDTEGVNEIAKCNVDYYSIEYENKAIYKMFQSEKNFELESYIEEEKKENENNEQEE